MNARQVADELENIYWIQGDGKGKPFQQYADFVRQQQEKLTKYELRHAEQRKRIEELEEKCLALKELGIIGAVTSGKKIEGGIVAEPRMLIKFIEDAYNK